MRTRVLAHYARDKEALVADWEQNLATSTTEFSKETNRYALAVAYWENAQYAEATDTLAPLLDRYPNLISLVVTQAEIYTKQNEAARAINYLERHLEINPDNHALTMAYVDALVESRAYNAAAEVIENHTKVRISDHHLWYQLAETWGQAGDISKVHQARAEYFVLISDFRNARQQLQFALRIETDNDANPAVEARLRQKIKEVEDMQRSMSG
jgi:predicted Zn-dependent protease